MQKTFNKIGVVFSLSLLFQLSAQAAVSEYQSTYQVSGKISGQDAQKIAKSLNHKKGLLCQADPIHEDQEWCLGVECTDRECSIHAYVQSDKKLKLNNTSAQLMLNSKIAHRIGAALPRLRSGSSHVRGPDAHSRSEEHGAGNIYCKVYPMMPPLSWCEISELDFKAESLARLIKKGKLTEDEAKKIIWQLFSR